VTSQALRRARVIRRRITDVPFAAVTAYLGINNMIVFALHPGTQSAGLLASPLDYVWVGMFGLGGLLIFAGLVTALANVEAGGCVLLAGGALISGLAIAVVRGLGAWNVILTMVILTTFSLVRAYHLFRGRVLVLVTLTDDQDVPGDRP